MGRCANALAELHGRPVAALHLELHTHCETQEPGWLPWYAGHLRDFLPRQRHLQPPTAAPNTGVSKGIQVPAAYQSAGLDARLGHRKSHGQAIQ